jgi:hypothetical protein
VSYITSGFAVYGLQVVTARQVSYKKQVG